jgi:hypothetical protein
VGTEVGLNTSFRTIGQAVGVAISGAFLASYVFPGTELPTDLAYGYTAIVGIVMGILGLLIAATLPTLKVPEGGSAAVG